MSRASRHDWLAGHRLHLQPPSFHDHIPRKFGASANSRTSTAVIFCQRAASWYDLALILPLLRQPAARQSSRSFAFYEPQFGLAT